MRIVLQRVKEARVDVNGKTVGRIGRGVCLLVGVERGDGEADAERLARKVVELRVFPDAEGKMNLSLAETGVFQALMDVHILNDGPVTFILDSRKGTGSADEG
jgi:D-Tyr-tRNAtyr deacylase